MNKKQLIPSLALAAIIGAGMTLPMTASAEQRPDRHDRVEQGHKKGDRHEHRDFGHNKPVHFDQGRHFGHDKHHDHYRYRDGYRYYDRHHKKWHKPYHKGRYYETYRPHHHYYGDDTGRIRVIFDYDILM